MHYRSELSGRKNVLRKLLRIPYRRLKAGFSVTVFDNVRLFVCHWQSHWLRLNEMHKVWTFASRKAFILLCGFCFSSLENYFGLGTTNGKGKTDHPVSLRSGIKSFEHSKKASILIEHSIYLWVVFAVSRWAELKPTCILLLINTFSHAQVYSLCRTSFIHLFSQTTFCAL